MAKTCDPSDYVHLLRGRWVIARYSERANQWHAPMRQGARKLTGCHTECARVLDGLSLVNLYHYKNRKDAVATARTIFDFEARDYSDAAGTRGRWEES